MVFIFSVQVEEEDLSYVNVSRNSTAIKCLKLGKYLATSKWFVDVLRLKPTLKSLREIKCYLEPDDHSWFAAQPSRYREIKIMLLQRC